MILTFDLESDLGIFTRHPLCERRRLVTQQQTQRERVHISQTSRGVARGGAMPPIVDGVVFYRKKTGFVGT